MSIESMDREQNTLGAAAADVREETLPPNIKVPEATVAAVSELLQKRDGLIAEVKRLEAICDGLVEDFARQEQLPLDRYRYSPSSGYLEQITAVKGE